MKMIGHLGKESRVGCGGTEGGKIIKMVQFNQGRQKKGCDQIFICLGQSLISIILDVLAIEPGFSKDNVMAGVQGPPYA